MSLQDWFRDRVDVGLLSQDGNAGAADDAPASPFERVFTAQGGAASPAQAAAHTQAFQQFITTGAPGDTLIFFTHADTVTVKVPRQGALEARERARAARAGAANAQAAAEAKKKAAAEAADAKTEEEGKEGGEGEVADAPPNAAADADALATSSGSGAAAAADAGTDAAAVAALAGGTGSDEADFLSVNKPDGDGEPLYDIVTKQRFRYRCVTAQSIEELLVRAARTDAARLQTADDGGGVAASALSLSVVGEEEEDSESDAAAIMSSMRQGVVYFIRKDGGNLNETRSAKQLGIAASVKAVAPGTLRDLSLAATVEWGCLRGLSTRNLTHLNTAMHAIYMPFLDSQIQMATGSVGAKLAAEVADGGAAAGKSGSSGGGSGRGAVADGGAAADGSIGSVSTGFWAHASEFQSQMSKFVGQLDSAIQQTHGRVALPMRREIILDPERADQVRSAPPPRAPTPHNRANTLILNPPSLPPPARHVRPSAHSLSLTHIFQSRLPATLKPSAPSKRCSPSGPRWSRTWWPNSSAPSPQGTAPWPRSSSGATSTGCCRRSSSSSRPTAPSW